MAGCCENSKSDKRQFSLVLKATKGQVILRSEHYNSKRSAQNGIASVQRNAPDNAR